MKDRLKILDCNRKAILGLPEGAFKLWFTYYMNEDEGQESFLTIPEIETQTGMSRPTIIKWTGWLVRHKWLVDTGKTAADKWRAVGRPVSPNAHQVTVYRVDDPTTKDFLLVENAYQSKNFTGHELKILTQGSGSASGSGSGSHFAFDSGSGSSSINPPAADGGEVTPAPKAKEESKTETNPAGVLGASPESESNTKTGKPKAAPDGTPWPSDFDSWENAQRLEWLCANGLRGAVTKAQTNPLNIWELGEEPEEEKRRLTPSLEAQAEIRAEGARLAAESRKLFAAARSGKPSPLVAMLEEPLGKPATQAAPRRCEYCCMEEDPATKRITHHKNCDRPVRAVKDPEIYPDALEANA
jgi:hypothetical protein